MSVEILLNQRELDYALLHSVARLEDAKAKGYKHKYDNGHLSPEQISHYNFVGCCAEIAVAKWLKVPNFELTINTFKNEPDVAPDWEVKHSEYAGAHLVIKDNDRDDNRAVLVTGLNPFTIRGWLPVKYCKDDMYLKTTVQNTAYWVPQNELVKVS
jgi:hypothetical protein